MKYLRIICFFVLTVSIYSCDPTATFDKPQPENVKSMDRFPDRLLGRYLSEDQISQLTVYPDLITIQYDFDLKQHKDSLGNSYKIVNDTLFDNIEGTHEKIVITGDSIVRHVAGVDTLFKISSDDILKKFKGYYFMNTRRSESQWEVRKLDLQKGKLSISYLSSKDDLNKLRELTESTNDTISTHFSLTKKQFKRFIKQKGFKEMESFTKISSNGR